jgi:3-oxoadipate enol-lactonase
MPMLTEWRVVRVDHPGHGESPLWNSPVTIAGIGKAVLDVLDGLRYERASFCGLSLGGAIAQWIAAHAPERVQRLVLCSTAACFTPQEVYLERAATVRREGLEIVAGATMERWFTPGFRAQAPEIVDRYRRMVAATSPEGYAQCCEAVARFDGGSDLSRIVAPAIVIAGAEDPATPPDRGRELQHGIRGARLKILQSAAHLLNVEQPEETADAILRHPSGEDHG